MPQQLGKDVAGRGLYCGRSEPARDRWPCGIPLTYSIADAALRDSFPWVAPRRSEPVLNGWRVTPHNNDAGYTRRQRVAAAVNHNSTDNDVLSIYV